MKRKLLALFLALVMVCSLAASGFADAGPEDPTAPASTETADQDARLAKVTELVKKTLDLNTDAFTSFYGDVEENPLAQGWYLSWSNEDGESLNIEAMEDGKIISYNYYSPSEEGSVSSSDLPHFPKGDEAEARKAAEAFLAKVLTKAETAAFDEDYATSRLNATEYRFAGDILVNGVSADLSFNIRVRCADNKVTGFNRDENSPMLLEDYPDAKAAVDAAKAAQTLRGTLEMKLEYVLPDADATQAVLRYLPVYGDDYYVDAKTGELVNLTEVYEKAGDGNFTFGIGGAANDSAEEAPEASPEEEKNMSQAELEGIAKLEGVMSRDDLDAAIRKIAALGLGDYTLGSASYSVERDAPEGETPQVTAYVRYGKQVGKYTLTRAVTVDARTGKLLQVSSYGNLPEDTKRPITFEEAQTKAEAFLKDQYTASFNRMDIYDSTEMNPENSWDWTHFFNFCEKHNGYFFAGNSLRVSVDATDGSIAEYHPEFNLDITFDTTDGIISEDKAIDAWLGTYDTTLHYVNIPAAIDFSKPPYDALEDWGISYLFKPVLGYSLTQERGVQGIDAKTGDPVPYDSYSYGQVGPYDDIAGHWAKAQIEKLAAFDIGFQGEQFQPDKTLTQLDLLALVLTVKGYDYDITDETNVDDLYATAYRYGLLTKEERDDDAAVTRIQVVKTVMDSIGFGSIAKLEGIYKTGFADESEIPAGLVGYAALAKGLGIVSGASGKFLPSKGCTRAEAAVMLYNLLSK